VRSRATRERAEVAILLKGLVDQSPHFGSSRHSQYIIVELSHDLAASGGGLAVTGLMKLGGAIT
jgi:hypothetical protein